MYIFIYLYISNHIINLIDYFKLLEKNMSNNNLIQESLLCPISNDFLEDPVIVPCCTKAFSREFLKNSLREFLKRTSTISKGVCPSGKAMLDNQSNTLSLLQPPEPQEPLLLQPAGIFPGVVWHPLPDVHPAQAISFFLYLNQ